MTEILKGFELTDEIRQLGVSKVLVTKDSLYVYNGKSFTQSRYYKNKLQKTLDELKEKLTHDGCFGDEKTVKKIILLLSEIWVRSEEESNGKDKKKVKQEFDADKKYNDSIVAEINKLREDNAGITSESWKTELIRRYDTLRCVVKENMPEIWTGLEFELCALRILNIVGNTLPLIAILLARPGSGKTQILNMLRRWPYSYYTDGFTAKSFVSHSTSVSKEELEIDMLPRIENKIFLTPELAAMFGLKDDDLKQVLGLVTRLADGNGLSNDSGAHGHRGYNRDIMFVWVGAAVDIPHKVYKILAEKGAKVYFFRLPFEDKSEDEYIEELKQNFNAKSNNIQTVLFDYLKWFEIGPDLILDKSIYKMKWNDDEDDVDALRCIVKIAELLSHLRCVAKTWHTEDTQGSDYGYAVSQPEERLRAARALRNISRAHALLTGRNHITKEDIPIAVKMALSTAQIERVSMFDLLISNNGILTTQHIQDFLNMSGPTARRTMREFEVIGLVNRNDTGCGMEISLKDQFDWFISDEFKQLREGFEPIDNSAFLDSKKEKNPSTTINKKSSYSIMQIDTFWRIFSKLEEASKYTPDTMTDDKDTVGGHELRRHLESSGKFDEIQAFNIIEDMCKQKKIREVIADTYRRVLGE
jgi:hypothetical protein